MFELLLCADKNALPWMSSMVLVHISLVIQTVSTFDIGFSYLCLLNLLYECAFLFLHLFVLVKSVDAFCPGISYQLAITIAYLNHSYLIVKSLVNFGFSLLLVLHLVCMSFECVSLSIYL